MGARFPNRTTVFHPDIEREESAPWACMHAIDYSDCADCALGWARVGFGLWCLLFWITNARTS